MFIEELENRLVDNAALEASVRANTPENARLTFDHVVGDLLQDMVDTNFELYKRVTDDEDFGKFFKDRLYDRYRGVVEETAPGQHVPDIVQAAVKALVTEMSPKRVVLFGSASRGEMTDESDIDLMVLVDGSGDRREEISRARAAVRPFGISFDIHVYGEQEVDEWIDVVGHPIHHALTEGRTVYDAA